MRGSRKDIRDNKGRLAEDYIDEVKAIELRNELNSMMVLYLHIYSYRDIRIDLIF